MRSLNLTLLCYKSVIQVVVIHYPHARLGKLKGLSMRSRPYTRMPRRFLSVYGASFSREEDNVGANRTS